MVEKSMGSACTGMPMAVRASAMRTAISAVVGAVDAVGQRSFWGGIFLPSGETRTPSEPHVHPAPARRFFAASGSWG